MRVPLQGPDRGPATMFDRIRNGIVPHIAPEGLLDETH